MRVNLVIKNPNLVVTKYFIHDTVTHDYVDLGGYSGQRTIIDNIPYVGYKLTDIMNQLHPEINIKLIPRLMNFISVDDVIKYQPNGMYIFDCDKYVHSVWYMLYCNSIEGIQYYDDNKLQLSIDEIINSKDLCDEFNEYMVYF